MAKRINLDLNSEKELELKILLEASGCSTMKEFFNNLLTLYKWALLKKKDGRDIGSFKDGVFYEVEMPILGGIEALKYLDKSNTTTEKIQNHKRRTKPAPIPA